MLDPEDVKNRLRAFVCTELIRNPGYALRDDEPLVTGGLIDSFAIAQIGVFVEKAFGVYLPDTDLTVENMDDLARMTACVLATAEKGAPE
jgi:acyl carrier protein